MYVCICRALNEKQVEAAALGGAKRAAAVFKAHGCRPNCGLCLKDMQTVIDSASRAEGPAIRKAS
ncbi:MAG: (2Fe-2S)-binding protein [Pseudomonadota bacterium]